MEPEESEEIGSSRHVPPLKKGFSCLEKGKWSQRSPIAIRIQIEIRGLGVWSSDWSCDTGCGWGCREFLRKWHTNTKNAARKKRVEYNIIIIRSKAAKGSYYLIWNWAVRFCSCFFLAPVSMNRNEIKWNANANVSIACGNIFTDFRFRALSFLLWILILRFDLCLLLIVPRFFLWTILCNIGGCIFCLGYKWYINTYFCLTLKCWRGCFRYYSDHCIAGSFRKSLLTVLNYFVCYLKSIRILFIYILL